MAKQMKVLVVDPFDAKAINNLIKKFDVLVELHPNRERLVDIIGDKDILILRSGIQLDKPIIDQAKNLKLVARAGNGMDNIDVDTLNSRGVSWFNVPALSTRDVAEFTFGLILSVARKIACADAYLRKNEWKKKEMIGTSLYGKVLGLVGYGKIAKEVASIAKAFGMPVSVYVRNYYNKTFESGVLPVSFSYLLEKSDVISLHVPLTDETTNLIAAEQLMSMKRSAFLINMSRGGIVNETDLYYALKNNVIAGAATDVFQVEKEYSKLFELENIVVTPHIGAMTLESQERIGEAVVKRIMEFFGNEVD